MENDIGELPPGQAPIGIDNDNIFFSFDGAVANQIPAAYAPSAPPKFSMIPENKASDQSKFIEEEMKYNHYSAILPSAPKGSINGNENGNRHYGSMEMKANY